ncbi:MAG: hypothetical protein HY396_02475 [Candidatus Doudnabacteria bacterium]|nr:hypothetical protein [Candidatus Doudnabacteria bacterium]
MKAVKPIPVRSIAFHKWVHFDEAAAFFLARQYGADIFPGIESAAFQFWGTGGTPDGKTAEEWLQKRGVLCFGIGSGPFDEHVGDHGKRMAHECSATLIAEYLGVRKNLELNDLLNYVLATDEAPIQSPMSLPTILKDVNLLYRDEPAEVVSWLLPAIEAHVQRRERILQREPDPVADQGFDFDLALGDYLIRYHHHYGAERVYPGLGLALDRYLAEGGKFDHRSVISWLKSHGSEWQIKSGKHLSSYLARVLGLGTASPYFDQLLKYEFAPEEQVRPLDHSPFHFELKAVLRELFALWGGNVSQTLKWVRSAIAAKVSSSQNFEECKQEYRQAVVEQTPSAKGPLALATIHSDNPAMIKYFRSKHAESLGCHADVLIQQTSTGNVQIFGSNAPNGEEPARLDDVARLIRLEELRARGVHSPVDWKELGQDGWGPDRTFYFFREGNQILNGSLSVPDISPTRQTLDQVKERVKFALDPDAFPEPFARDCRAGRCTSTRQRPCPVYAAGLHRCRYIRWKQNQPAG